MTALPALVRLPRVATALARPADAQVTITDAPGVALGPFRASGDRREMVVVLHPYRAAMWGFVLVAIVMAVVASSELGEDWLGALFAALLASGSAWMSWKMWRQRVRISVCAERLVVEADGRPISLPMSAVRAFEIDEDRATCGPGYLIAAGPDGETSLLSLPQRTTLQWLQQVLEQRIARNAR